MSAARVSNMEHSIVRTLCSSGHGGASCAGAGGAGKGASGWRWRRAGRWRGAARLGSAESGLAHGRATRTRQGKRRALLLRGRSCVQLHARALLRMRPWEERAMRAPSDDAPGCPARACRPCAQARMLAEAGPRRAAGMARQAQARCPVGSSRRLVARRRPGGASSPARARRHVPAWALKGPRCGCCHRQWSAAPLLAPLLAPAGRWCCDRAVPARARLVPGVLRACIGAAAQLDAGAPAQSDAAQHVVALGAHRLPVSPAGLRSVSRA